MPPEQQDIIQIHKKNTGHENSRASPLKTEGIAHRDAKVQSEILNDQFVPVPT